MNIALNLKWPACNPIGVKAVFDNTGRAPGDPETFQPETNTSLLAGQELLKPGIGRSAGQQKLSARQVSGNKARPLKKKEKGAVEISNLTGLLNETLHQYVTCSSQSHQDRRVHLKRTCKKA